MLSSEVWLQRISESLFDVVGSHSDSADISGVVTLAKPAGATKLMLQTLTQNVRLTLDGSDPSANRGFLLTAGNDPVIINIGPNVTVKVIQTAATADFQYQWGK